MKDEKSEAFSGSKWNDTDALKFETDPKKIEAAREQRIKYLKQTYGDAWRDHALPGDVK